MYASTREGNYMHLGVEGVARGEEEGKGKEESAQGRLVDRRREDLVIPKGTAE